MTRAPTRWGSHIPTLAATWAEPARIGAVQARFPDRLRLPLQFDPSLLREDLDALGGAEWLAHFVKQNYEGDWSVIPLRGQAGAVHPVMLMYSNPAATEFADTPLLARTPYFRRVLQDLACPLQSVRLMRLTPGSTIKEHRDHDLAAEFGLVRLHIPITTTPDIDFRLNGTRVIMQAGSVWYLRLSDPHSVSNRSISDRVHLVIDAEVNDWLNAQLERAFRLLST